MARTDGILLCWALALAGLGVLVGIDLLFAIGAQSCGSPAAGPDCYPWGTEGPVAGSWRYASRTHYVLSGAVLALLPIAMVAFVVWTTYAGRFLTPVRRVVIALGLAGTTVLTLL